MTIKEIEVILRQLKRPMKRSLGQNFLLDKNFASGVVGQLELQPGDWVVEIGPGLGMLTGELLAAGARVLALELDRDWAARLRETFRNEALEVVEGDAMDFDLRRLWTGEPVKIIGNLPYNLSTAMITKFGDPLCPAERMVFTVQKEVAKRITARHDSGDYGGYSVACQLDWRTELVQVVGPEVFYPRPQVDSAVVRLDRKPGAEIVRCPRALLDRLVRQGFNQRRKQLKNRLPYPREAVESALADCGLPPTSRAENLDLAAWAHLANTLEHPDVVTAASLEEVFDVVDELDRVVGSLPRSQVHEQTLRHRAVHILLFNGAGELFLQKRAWWKDINPGVWDSSAAGHLASGEDYDVAAPRELQEELGVSVPLEKAGKLSPCDATGNEFIQIYTGVAEGPFRLAEMEIATGAFFPMEQIRSWAARAPKDFSPVFLECLKLQNLS